MKRFITPTLIVLATLTQSASALVGGPFDNGLHGAQLENAIYQAVFSFPNGNGFCYFRPDADIVSELGPTDTVGVDSRGEIENRTSIYYKGISYIGAAIGMADPQANYIQCNINGTSELSTQTTVQNNNNAGLFLFGGGTTTTGNTNTVIQSARGFTVNGSFEAKFKTTAPVKRFVGKGELVFLSPSGPDAVAGLAYQAYSGLVGAIINAVTNAGQTGLGILNGAIFTDAQNAIDALLIALPAQLVGSGLDAAKENGDTVRVRVMGTMRY